MSVQIRGKDPSKQLIRRSTGTLEMQEDGTWKGTVVYSCTWAALATLAPKRNLSKHPDFSGLLCVSCRAAREKGGMALLTVSYGGDLTAGQSPPETEYEVLASTSEAPIETHELFFRNLDAEDLRTIKEAVKNPKAGQSPALTKPEAIKLYTKLMQGQQSYHCGGAVARKTSYGSSRPSVLSKIGKIDDPGFAPAEGYQNYLKTSHAWKRKGGVYVIEESWILSGNYGWDPDLYS